MSAPSVARLRVRPHTLLTAKTRMSVAIFRVTSFIATGGLRREGESITPAVCRQGEARHCSRVAPLAWPLSPPRPSTSRRACWSVRAWPAS